jgi:hypothetical protein
MTRGLLSVFRDSSLPPREQEGTHVSPRLRGDGRGVVFLNAGLCLCFFAIMALSGCKRSNPPAPSTPAKVETVTPAPAPVQPPVDSRVLLDEFMQKRVVMQKQLADLMKSKSRDTAAIRDLLLRRKGEVLSMQKHVRQITTYSQAEKDSLLKIIESESIDLSTKLVSLNP